MSYLKFSADQIFTGTELLSDQLVLITDNNGSIVDLVAEENAGDEIQHHQGILAPGFVNAHCHLELSHMKGLIPEHTGLPQFILKIVNERHHSEDLILNAIANAEAAMIANGIVAVGDISNNALTIAQKQLGNLAYHNFIEVSGWKPAIALPRYENALQVYSNFNDALNIEQRINSNSKSTNISINPHAPYSVSNDLWELLQPHFEDGVITIHNQENPAENQLFENGEGDFVGMYQAMNIDQTHFTPTGKTSLLSVLPKMQKARNILLVHNTESTPQDILFANQQAIQQNQHIHWCLCPNANLYIENKMPPIEMLRRYNVNITIGTDSLASNHQLSILEELKTISTYSPEIPLEELLQWATFNGAKALQLDHQLGSFEKGKKPGLILLTNIENEQLNTHSKIQRII
ncbi:MAG: amidohydrolase family protein [Sediminibacterium sp.]|nr:amidohydrolase family protein [Sediminibacterium sp.]